MAWNEPGGNGKKDNGDDGWGPKKGKDNEGPPDLDEAFKQLGDKVKSIFGGKGSGGGNGDDGSSYSQGDSKKLLLPIILLGCMYIAAGFFVVKPADRAVITRLGKYQEDVGQGLHWIPLFIKSKQIVNTEKIRSIRRSGLMLTQDINLVSVEIEVQYRINNVQKYLFNMQNPEKAIEEAADSALRQVVGHNNFDYIISIGKEQIATQVSEQLQKTLDHYRCGIKVTTLALKEAIYPKEVEKSFDDVTRAKEELEQLKHDAEAYANKVVPEAEGHSKKLIQLAKAYAQEVVLKAEGETMRFNAIYPEYKRAPDVTRARLYLATLQEVYSTNSKVFVDVPSGNNLMYLPIEKLMSTKSDDVTNSTVVNETEVVSNNPAYQNDIERTIAQQRRHERKSRQRVQRR